LLGTAYGVLGHREDAREAVQEAFLKCWRRRHDAPSLRTPRAWVFSVVLNAARDLRRRRKVRRTGTLPPEDVMPPSSTVADPAATAERREAVSRAREAIGHLPDAEKEVFLLRQNGELTFTQIGESLGIPVGTAKTRMRAALRRLREALDAGPSTRPAAGGTER
ncbi:MAG: RNA polymerase sigma factor, partial [Planctomycetota bacterium]